MNLKWFAGLEKDDAKRMKALVAEARPVLERLATILEAELENSLEESSKKDNYFMPAWSEYQASRLGTQSTLRRIIKLISED